MNSPIEAIRETMATRGLRTVDMLDVFGTHSRYSQIMNRRRKLSIRMIRTLHFKYGINATVLLQDYEVVKA